jgi:PKD repeat protein
VTASHTYAAAGTYTVTLTVTDDDNGTDSETAQVTVEAVDPGEPGAQVLAADSFTRSSASGWGTSDVGGAWVHSGAASLFPVQGDAGRLVLSRAGSGPRARLAGVSAADTDVSVVVSMDKLSNVGTTRLWLAGRADGFVSEYQLKANVASTGVVSSLQLGRRVDNAESIIRTVTVPGLRMAAGDRMVMRLQIQGTGTTNLRAKVWPVGSPEPAAWQLEATDTTAALQRAGTVGVGAYTAASTTNVPITVTWDDLRATTIG